MRKLLVAVALFSLIPGVASAGGGGGDISQCPGFAAGTTIAMLDSCFSGIAHFAPTDNTITISNDGQLPHTFTAVDGSFNSGQMLPGETFELTIDEPGMFRVFCTLHGTAQGGGMAGVLVVGEAEPQPVAAAIDVSAIKQAVAEENQALIEVLDSQAETFREIRVTQAELEGSLKQLSTAAPVEPAAPMVVTVPAQSGVGSLWLALAAGLAVGLSIAALITALRSRGQDDRAEGLETSLETTL